MADPRYPVVTIGGVPVGDAPEEIDAENAESFHELLLHAASCGHGTVVVNMAGTRFCDSSGMHVLAEAHERAVRDGGQLVLVISSAAVLRVLALTGLDQVIPIFTDMTEALEASHAVVPRPLHRPATPSAEAGPLEA
jgi:anti-anti-sigma factor